MLLSELIELCCPHLVLAYVSNDACGRRCDLANGFYSFSGKECIFRISVHLTLPERVHLILPVREFLLLNCRRQPYKKVFDIAADAQVYGYVLAYLGAVAVELDLLGIKRIPVSLARGPVGESYADAYHEVCFRERHGRREMPVHTLHSEEPGAVRRDLGQTHHGAPDISVYLICEGKDLLSASGPYRTASEIYIRPSAVCYHLGSARHQLVRCLLGL